VLSVRFSSEEIDHLKQAAKLKGEATATFVRKTASKASVETINAMSRPAQSNAIERLAKEITKQLMGQGQVCVSKMVQIAADDYEDVELHMDRYTECTYGPGEDPRNTTVSSDPVSESDMKQLMMALQHAAQPFSEALQKAILESQSVGDGIDDSDFRPIISLT
jgi:hypothetical protein